MLVGIVLALVLYGQLIVKHQVSHLGPLPDRNITDQGRYLLKALTNLGICSGPAAAFMAAIWLIRINLQHSIGRRCLVGGEVVSPWIGVFDGRVV